VDPAGHGGRGGRQRDLRGRGGQTWPRLYSEFARVTFTISPNLAPWTRSRITSGPDTADTVRYAEHRDAPGVAVSSMVSGSLPGHTISGGERAKSAGAGEDEAGAH